MEGIIPWVVTSDPIWGVKRMGTFAHSLNPFAEVRATLPKQYAKAKDMQKAEPLTVNENAKKSEQTGFKAGAQ